MYKISIGSQGSKERIVLSYGRVEYGRKDYDTSESKTEENLLEWLPKLKTLSKKLGGLSSKVLVIEVDSERKLNYLLEEKETEERKKYEESLLKVGKLYVYEYVKNNKGSIK